VATDFRTVLPAEILKGDTLAEYGEAMKSFHRRLVELRTNLVIVEKIVQFPFDLFSLSYEHVFFPRVVHNFLQVAVLQITKLATDSGSDTLTLSEFKNRVLNWVRDEYRGDYQQRLKTAKFDVRTQELLTKAHELRNNRIAHDLRESLPGIEQGDHLTLGDLKSLADELVRLFEVAKFANEYKYDFISYEHHEGSNARSDIEKVLDGVVRESHGLNWPEEHPEVWVHKRARWSQSKLDQFNQYRRKFGLPEV
jgi:AbiU2